MGALLARRANKHRVIDLVGMGALHRRQSHPHGQGVDAGAVGDHERIRTDIKGLRAALDECLERGGDILRSPNFKGDDLKAEHSGRGLNFAYLNRDGGIVDIRDMRHTAQIGDDLAQEFELFAIDGNASVSPSPGSASQDIESGTRPATINQ
jgi:hypothetical protein